MTKTQRNILLFLPLQALVIFIFFYLTRYWLIGIVFQVVLTLTMIRRSLAGGSRSMVVAKSVQPIMFAVFASMFSMLLVQLYGISMVFFGVLMSIIVLGYGAMSYRGLRSNVGVGYASIISMMQIVLVTNFVVLAMAYWRLPGVVSLPLLFIAILVLVGWWLIETLRSSRDIVVISSVWGLIVCELVWVFSHWIVVYQLPSLNIVVAQAAVIVGALSYTVGGLYYHQRQGSLRPQLIFEYSSVFVIVFVVTLVAAIASAGL